MVHVIVIIGILLCSASQLLLKKSAVSEHSNFMTSMLNWRVVLAYAIFFSSLLINVTAMKYGLQLKELPILESLGYIFVPFLSWLFLKEKINKQSIIAMMLIIMGVCVFNL